MNLLDTVPISTILSDRDVGYMRVEILRRHGETLEMLLKNFRLSPTLNGLQKVDRQRATEAVEILLWKSLAYGLEMLPRDVAKTRAIAFMDQLGNFATEIYSNSDWDGEELSGWNPMTNATFDKGLLFISDTLAVCLWVEEED